MLKVYAILNKFTFSTFSTFAQRMEEAAVKWNELSTKTVEKNNIGVNIEVSQLH